MGDMAAGQLGFIASKRERERERERKIDLSLGDLGRVVGEVYLF